MLFDFKKKSKHLIGIDAEVYILYEDKVLLKSWEKSLDMTIFIGFFLLWHPSVMNRTAVIASITVLIIFLVQEKKKQCFLSRS